VFVALIPGWVPSEEFCGELMEKGLSPAPGCGVVTPALVLIGLVVGVAPGDGLIPVAGGLPIRVPGAGTVVPVAVPEDVPEGEDTAPPIGCAGIGVVVDPVVP